MSGNQRVGLIVAAIVIAVVAFVIASSGGDDKPSTKAAAPAKPQATKIQIQGKKVVGGPQEIRVKNGDTVEIVVSADASNDLHLHGYNIEKTAKPGQPARFKFKADAEGQFDLESHTFEDAGLEAQLATLIVEPR